MGGAESGFSLMEELYLEGLLLLFFLGATYGTTQVGRNAELVLRRRGLLSSCARLQKASVCTSAVPRRALSHSSYTDRQSALTSLQ